MTNTTQQVKKLGTTDEQLEKVIGDIEIKLKEFADKSYDLVENKNTFKYFSKEDRSKLLENSMKSFDELEEVYKAMVKLYKGVKRQKITPEVFFKELNQPKV